jgi:hypothetical protein
MLALTVILDGGSRSEVTRLAGVALRIVCDLVLCFNEGGGTGHLALMMNSAPGRLR